MRITVLQTFVVPTAKGMIVGNAGDQLDIDDALIEQLGDRVSVLDAPPDYAMTVFDPETSDAQAGLLADYAGLSADYEAQRQRLLALLAPVVGPDGQPMNPPAADLADAIANPSTIAPSANGEPLPVLTPEPGAPLVAVTAEPAPQAAAAAPAPVRNKGGRPRRAAPAATAEPAPAPAVDPLEPPAA